MDLYLDVHGKRIWMAAKWRQDLPALAEAIPGAGFTDTENARAWAKDTMGLGVGQGGAVKGAFTFPLSYRTCMDIRAQFQGERIVIMPGLRDWAWNERNRREDLAAIMEMEDHPLPVLEKEYPRLAAALHNRSFQAVGVAYAVRARSCIIGDQPGLGKTLQAAAALIEAQTTGPILVLAPSAAATITWPDEFDDWFPHEVYFAIDGSKERRAEGLDEFLEEARAHPDERTWCFANFEMLQPERVLQEHSVHKNGKPETVRTWVTGTEPRFPQLRAEPWAGIIVDESHRILPTKSSLADKQSLIRRGVQRLPTKRDPMKMALSGTPMKGNPLNLWGALHWLFPEQYTGYWSYVNRWFEIGEKSVGADEVVNEVLGLDAEVEKQFGEEIDAIMIRRTKAEVAPFLPAKVYAGTRMDPDDESSPVGIWLDMGSKQKAAYDSMVADAVAHLDSGELMAAGVLAEMTRCRQMSSAYGDVEHVLQWSKYETGMFEEWVAKFRPSLPSNKWDWVEEFLHERGIWRPKDAWGESKVVIASWQTPLLKLMHAELTKYKIPAHILHGGTSNAARRQAKTEFQAPGGPRVFLLNTIAGGVSLTLDAADDMIVLDETWVPDDQEQVEDRIHRIGRPDHQATYWYVRSRGTIEEHIARVTTGKDDIQKRLMDGRRGVDYAKRLLTGG